MKYSKQVQAGILRANAKLLKDAEYEKAHYLCTSSQEKLERVQRLGLMGVPSRRALGRLLYSFVNHEHGARDRSAEINGACKRILGEDYSCPTLDLEYRNKLLEISRNAWHLGAFEGDGMEAKMLLAFHRVREEGA